MKCSASREESSSSSGFEDRDFQRGPKWSEHKVKVMPEGGNPGVSNDWCVSASRKFGTNYTPLCL